MFYFSCILGRDWFLWFLCLLWYTPSHRKFSPHQNWRLPWGRSLFFFGVWGHNVLDIIDLLSVFLVSVLHFIVCSSMDTPLYWFDPWPAFYHCLLSIRRFLAKSHIHTWIFSKKSRIHAGFWTKYAYTYSFLAKSHVYTQMFFKQSHTSSLLVSLMLGEVARWVVSVVGSSLGLMLSIGCLCFMTRDHFFIDFLWK